MRPPALPHGFLRRLLSTSTLTLAIGPAAALYAADEPAARPDHAPLFKKLDADGDGKLTTEEVPDEQRRLLERLVRSSDKDKDGKLSADEFAAGLAEERPQGDLPAGGGPGAPGGRPGGADPEQFFRMLDRNGDGKVTVDEVPEERRERFKENLARLDEDKDGAASREEFRKGFAGRGAPAGQPGRPGRPGEPGRPQPGEPGRPPMAGGPGMAGPLMAAIDADRDGELSADEITKAGDALKRLDRDGDGRVSGRELAAAGEAGNARPGAPPTGAPQTGGRGGPEQMLAYFKQQDKDGDGKLAKDEVGPRMQENFARMDADGDGKLDDAELKRAVQRMAGGGRPPEGRRPEGNRRPDGATGGDRPRPEAGRPEKGRPAGKPDGERAAPDAQRSEPK